MPIVEELLGKASHFHVLARKTSDPVTKERLLRLGEDYLAQAGQLKSERKVVQTTYPKSASQNGNF
jgi:hypothetical protein